MEGKGSSLSLDEVVEAMRNPGINAPRARSLLRRLDEPGWKKLQEQFPGWCRAEVVYWFAEALKMGRMGRK